MTTSTTIFTNTIAGSLYRVVEVFDQEWENCCKPIYFVERNQGDHDQRFFNIYIGENRERALCLAGSDC